jgi:hypothetical protein
MSEATALLDAGPVDIDLWISPEHEGFRVAVQRDGWPPGPCAEVVVERSQDADDFIPWLSFKIDGGGNEPVEVAATWPGEADENGDRRVVRPIIVRVCVTLLLPLRTAISVTPF